MRGRLTGDVPPVELGKCRLEIVGFESDESRDPFVAIDLDDIENVDVERAGLTVAGVSAATKRESLTPRGDDLRCDFLHPEGDIPLRIVD